MFDLLFGLDMPKKEVFCYKTTYFGYSCIDFRCENFVWQGRALNIILFIPIDKTLIYPIKENQFRF